MLTTHNRNHNQTHDAGVAHTEEWPRQLDDTELETIAGGTDGKVRFNDLPTTTKMSKASPMLSL
jgi:hypothetical protein